MKAERHFLVILLLALALTAVPFAMADPVEHRTDVLQIAESCVGWTEATGRNDGAKIDDILGSVGLRGTRNPYCAAFVYYCGMRAGFPGLYPRSAWSPDMVTQPTWTRAKGGREPQPGDTFGIYFPAKGRVAHTGFILRANGRTFDTIEANTSPEAASGSAADRDGGGVWRKRRLRSQVYSVRDWVSKPAN
jgi:hypothetical protein